jgi:hypothetical protein
LTFGYKKGRKKIPPKKCQKGFLVSK